MKTIICNVPLRSENSRTTYPPLGAMYVTQTLKDAGYDAAFYDINLFRFSFEEIQKFFLKYKPDVIGISATVSTSYAYTKKLAAVIRQTLPTSIIVVGGAITTSSEIILKYTDIDICVIGEGEKTMVNLLRHFLAHGFSKQDLNLKSIRGICFLNEKKQMEFTAYEDQIPVHEIPDPDYEILKDHSKIEGYIIDPFCYPQFKYDSRSFEKPRLNKKLATVVTSRGCVARCTFCHRWQKGIRIFPVDRMIQHIQFLMDHYDVGFISMGDEDFGASEKWVHEFIEQIAKLNILYRISATRVDHIDLSILKKYRESGCVAIHYGMESGANKMLKVMEKRTTADMNMNAAIWTHQANLQTVPAMVVGMPGESYETIEETAQFLQKITEYYPYEPTVSPNLLVALPGTPVYEYARFKGFLGNSLEEEEQYLIRVSDHGGESPVQFNFTDYPYFIVQAWVRYLIIAVYYHYNKVTRRKRISTKELCLIFLKIVFLREKSPSSIRQFISHPFIYYLAHFLTPLWIIRNNFKECSKWLFLERCIELIKWPFKRKTFTEYVSLRAHMNARSANVKEIKIQLTNPLLLRLGR